MTLTVDVPAGFEPERRHAVALVLHDVLGVDAEVVVDPAAACTTIRSGGGDGASLRVADGFFGMSPDAWQQRSSLPAPSVGWVDAALLPPHCRLVEPRLPVLFGGEGPVWTQGEGEALLNIDVFGTAFFLATRYEEAVLAERDEHGRFPVRASFAHRAQLLHRPLADEHAEVLWAALHVVWPRLQRGDGRFRILSTHDVDHPFALLNSGPVGMAREAASRARHRRDAWAALRTPWEWRAARKHGESGDPTGNFTRIMDADEAAGSESAFYFITDPEPVARVRRQIYRIEDPSIARLLREVHARGHEIGLHPSYNAHLDATRLRRELHALQQRCAEFGIAQAGWGGRFHYLRWDAARSPALWSDAGLVYDSSVAFAEQPGFRAGTCHPHHMWDFEHRRRLPALERPLIVMDISLTASKYMGLGHQAALDHIATLKRACRIVDGEFVVLWHNDVLAEPHQWDLYTAAIASV
jgi:hypothetical protein